MPIQLDGTDESPPAKPEANVHEVLALLLGNSDMGFSPNEIADITNVSYSNVHKTLSRLRDEGLARKVGSYWAITDDLTTSRKNDGNCGKPDA
jgi:Fic family protein